MSGRATAILDRFPQHLAANDPGKRLGAVVTGLAADIDVLTSQVQTVRGSHRLAELGTHRDLLLIAALHDIRAAALAIVTRREQVLATAIGADPADTDALAGLLGVPASRLAELGEGLAAAVGARLRHVPRMDRERAVVAGVIDAHRIGNGTPGALLTAAAAYLGLAAEQISHLPGGWWHVASVREIDRLAAPVPAAPDGGGQPAPPDLTPGADVLALEENPFHPAGIEPAPKKHAQRTQVLRGGMEDVDVTIRVTGTGAGTVRPMIVHLEAGRGLVFEGNVGDGAELAFRSNGRVTLDGSDATGSAWSFEGAVFADASAKLPGADFAFTLPDGTVPPPSVSTVTTATGQPSRFATAAPLAGAFDEPAPFPHGAAAVGPLQLPRGRSHWASLVRVAHTGALAGEPASPRTVAGRFDQSVFAATGPDDATTVMKAGFEWEEQEPFAVRVLLPRRLAAADDDAGTQVRQPLTALLARHRCAGIDVRVEYADPRWSLGDGVVRTGDDDAVGVVVSGTELWPDGSPQPGQS